jgi:LPXTG-motif cell wall-anchored protein
VTLAPGKGALQVKVWIDANRNGKKASSEKYMKDITVTIAGPNGATKSAKTDADGTVLFTDLDPGAWSVVSSLSVDGYEKVYDSDGSVNWKSNETVVAGQVSAASFAAATKASSVSSDSTDSLPATGSSSTPLAMIAGLFIMMGLVIVSSRKRQSL